MHALHTVHVAADAAEAVGAQGYFQMSKFLCQFFTPQVQLLHDKSVDRPIGSFLRPACKQTSARAWRTVWRGAVPNACDLAFPDEGQRDERHAEMRT
jgi:hypothetical protein